MHTWEGAGLMADRMIELTIVDWEQGLGAVGESILTC